MTTIGNERGSRGSGPAVKICGLKRRKDAEAALRAGADLLGVVLVPATPRGLSVEKAKRVVQGLGLPVVAVVADAPLDTAVRDAEALGAGILQLHGEESPDYAVRVREAGPWTVWKALRVKKAEDVLRGLEAYGEVVDGLLLDGWHPHRIGGAGVRFSWEDVSRVREAFPPTLRFIAAGGLDPQNVEEAVRRLSPDIVDVSSGVEVSPGIKDWEKIAEFVGNARRGSEGGQV